MLDRISRLCDDLFDCTEQLDQVLREEEKVEGFLKKAEYCRDRVLGTMEALRAVSDALEPCVAGKDWPFPTYGTLLYRV
jgi:glutamine synthetase